jgi:hypothetical protein
VAAVLLLLASTSQSRHNFVSFLNGFVLAICAAVCVCMPLDPRYRALFEETPCYDTPFYYPFSLGFVPNRGV